MNRAEYIRFLVLQAMYMVNYPYLWNREVTCLESVCWMKPDKASHAYA